MPALINIADDSPLLRHQRFSPSSPPANVPRYRDMPPGHTSSYTDDQPSHASGLRSRLAGIDEKIACLDAQLAILRTERELVSTTLASIIYPIMAIPPELTADILSHCVHANTDHPATRLRNALRVASVCQRWRAIAISTCDFWTSVSFDTDRAVSLVNFDASSTWNEGEDVLATWLRRAGGLPLELNINFYGSESSNDAILSILAQHSSQWMTFRLQSDQLLQFPSGGPLYALKRVGIDAAYHPFDGQEPITAFREAPDLHDVRLARLSRAHICLPWEQLINLSLSGHSAAHAFDILRVTPGLVSLSLVAITRAGGDHFITMPPQTLPHLRSLWLSGGGWIYLLPHLTLPSLEHLSLSDASHDGIFFAHLPQLFVDQSACSVQTLHCERTGFKTTSDFLQSMPSVCELVLETPPWALADFGEFFDQLAAIDSTPTLLPALESLHIKFRKGTLDIYSLVDMLEARWEGNEGIARLKSCYISSSSDDEGRSGRVEECIAQLRELRAEGMDINIHLQHKWSTREITKEMVFEIYHPV
ncbi:hypothetical protein C8R47DRAFT_1221252 [Mycena vitilis]|nr:hypothetical protein C8R47DRAFT_1221252 [Mycena vitilis]